MRELKIVDVDQSTLIVAHPDGEEFRVPVDGSMMNRLRGKRSESASSRVSPKDVQAHIRAGMSAEEVAALTGASLDFIARFEGPVLAERDYIVNAALAVETQASVAFNTGVTSTVFGALINSRLRELRATGERWASWKEADGTWVVKLEFEAATIHHDARWTFEPRKHAIAPRNSDAATLSQKGDLTTGIIPRLRAVPGEPGGPGEAAQNSAEQDSAGTIDRDILATVSRLDFAPDSSETLTQDVDSDEFTYETNVFVGMADLFSTTGVTERAPDDSRGQTGTSPTADLLEALRRRRGESEKTPAWLRDELAPGKSEEARTEETKRATTDALSVPTAPQPLFAPLPSVSPASAKAEPRGATQRTGSHAKRERTAMPSWDEIVFGTRSEEEPQ